EVFAPVARIEAIRLFLAYASFIGFMVYQMNVKSAFLYGTIEEQVYVCQPSGFEDPDYPDKVYKVIKALYGLHQAPRAWYETLANYLLENSFQRGKIDQTLFIKRQKGDILLVQIYVDDMIFVNQKKDGIFISQDKYVAEILRKFGLTYGKSATTPIDTEKPLLKDHDVKRIFRYLKGKPHLGLWYPKDSPFNLIAYSNSDYAGVSLDRKSTTGGCQFLGCRLISWQCKKQTVVATSSTEAEYVAAASCCAQVALSSMEYLKRVLHVTNILSAGLLTSQQMILNSPCLIHIKNWLVQIKRSLSKQTTLGKDKSNPLIVDSLLRTIWSSIHHLLINEVLTIPRQTATGLNTHRCDEDRLELMELTVFLLPSDKKVGVEVSAVDLQTSVAVKKVNDVTRLQALVEKKKVVITEASIRDALRLDDAEGIECLYNEEIFAELARMGYEKPSTKLTFYKAFFSSQWKFLIQTILQCVSAKRTSWNEFSSSMASTVICLSSGKGFSGVETLLFERMIVEHHVAEGDNDEVHVEDVNAAGVATEGVVSATDDVVPTADDEPSIPSPTPPTQPPQPSQDVPLTPKVEQLELDKIAQALEITKLKQWVKKLERRNKLKGGIITNINADEDVVLEDTKDVAVEKSADVEDNADIQGRKVESRAEIYKIDMEHAKKVLSMQEEESEPTEVQEVVDVVTTAKIITKVVTAASTTITAADVPIPAVTTAAAPTLIAAPSRRRKEVVIRDPEETTTTSTIIHSEAKSKDKGKGILVEEPKPLKKQAQIKQDEQYARELEAELNKNINWDKVIDHVQRKHKEDKSMDEEDSRALKRLNESQEEKAAKNQKLDEEVEELKRHLQIVPNEEDDVYTEATPLARKVSVVDYEIYNENNKPYYKIKRTDSSHQLYLSFFSLPRNFDREDLEALWSLVKERFATTKPKNFFDDFLLITLGAMFEKPDIHAQIWKNQRSVHGQAKVKSWKLLESCVEEENEVSLELLSFGVDAAMDFKEKHAKCLMLLVKELVLPSQDDAVD
nr:hypothetical protein [Tanacetum cinerariifolium]